MKIGVLTSSRADFGIYLPLLLKLKIDPFFELEIIAFGTHLDENFGYTLNEILDNGFIPKHKIFVPSEGDTPKAVSDSIASYIKYFSKFWLENSNNFDFVMCLGDRFEMFAAVISGIPFGIKYIHLHGGETTLGAIDDIFRHSITLASKIHFTATDQFSERVKMLLNSSENVYTVGSLSLDELSESHLLSENEFYDKWGVDLRKPTILVTVHPETVSFFDTESHANILASIVKEYSRKFQILITMPNADTYGKIIRNVIIDKLVGEDYIFVFENLGKQSYFSAMKYCSFLIGNTSSGIIEAASFNKYVVNLGDRQKGRLSSNNVINSKFELSEVRDSVEKIIKNKFVYEGPNLYFKSNVAITILNILKSYELK